MKKDLAVGLYTFAEFGLTAVTFLPVMAAVWHLYRGEPTQRVPGRLMRRFGRTTSDLTPMWRFRVEGTPPADIDRRGYVVVANHESVADPFLLSHLPWDMRWVAKQELFELPLIGRLMKYGGDIPLRRGRRESVVEMLAECRRTLEAGLSVMLFPEGTRSKDGALLPFKDGAFELALATGAPVLPIALAGTRHCMARGARWIGRANAIARVLPALPSAGRPLPELREQARDAIAAGVADLRVELGLPEPPSACVSTARAPTGAASAAHAAGPS